jgi:hypothetical protein
VNLSHRERIIAIATLAALVVLVLDRYVVSPFLDSRDRVQTDAATLAGKTEEAMGVFERGKRSARRWREMHEKGLKDDPGEAESQMLHALDDWADQTGVSLSSRKPERPEEGSGVQQIAFNVAGTGTMQGVARFLWDMESANLPLRIRDLTLGARTEGRDDLSFKVNLSTLYVAPTGPAGAAPAAPASGRTEEEGL